MLLQVPLWWRPRPRQRQRRRRLSLRSSSFLRSGRRTYAGADFVMSTVYTVRYQIPVHTSKNISANNLELWFVDRRCKGMQKVRPVQIIEIADYIQRKNVWEVGVRSSYHVSSHSQSIAEHFEQKCLSDVACSSCDVPRFNTAL